MSDFDFIGFTLQYELSFTNMLNMLRLSGVPIKSCDRKELKNIVVAGGPCACNPEPIADFVDIFFIGEGEEVDLEVIELFRKCRAEGKSKQEFLELSSKIEGVYVPALYDVTYNEDGTIKSFTPKGDVPAKIHKRIMLDMDKSFYPDNFVVPLVEIVHDRAVQEIFRGCIRGCRFCQAGMIYRPVREKSPETINKQCRALCDNTGYDEVSLSSLSSSDYSQIVPLLDKLNEWSKDEKVSISLPSLRVDGFTDDIMNKIKTVRKSGLTFAPEAGSQRMRDVINKNVREDELLQTCTTAFAGGWTTVKLYFMIGLPTETMDDVAAIAGLGQSVVDAYYKCPDKPKGKSVRVTVSASSFVPKPFYRSNGNRRTQFQSFMKSNSTSRTVLQQEKFSLTITMPIQAILKQYLQGVTENFVRLWSLHVKEVFILTAGMIVSALKSGLNSLMNAVLTRHFMQTDAEVLTKFFRGIISTTV